LTLTKTSFEKIYRYEQDVKTKERMLLVLNVVYQGMVAAHVARDLHRCKAWASQIKTTENAQRKYHKIIDLPKQADIETARSTYNNGILEVTFDKRKKISQRAKR
jgi:hypothetical protein